MKVSATISFRDLLEQLEVSSIPGCEFTPDEDVDLDVEADPDGLISDLMRLDHLEGDREQLPLHELRDALEALRKGDLLMARTLLTRMLDECEASVVEDALRQNALPLDAERL